MTDDDSRTAAEGWAELERLERDVDRKAEKNDQHLREAAADPAVQRGIKVRAQATEDALASVPEDVSHDRLLDFATTLRGVITGKLDGDRSVEGLNRTLSELFSAFTIFRELPERITREEVEDALKPGTVYVFPNLRREVAWRLVAEYDEDEPEPAPPLEWIEALAKSANTQESWQLGMSLGESGRSRRRNRSGPVKFRMRES